jgi:hypothetical protein
MLKMEIHFGDIASSQKQYLIKCQIEKPVALLSWGG